MTFPSWLPCWSDWSSYYHFNYSGYRWRLLRDGRRWRSPSFSIARSAERFSRNAETDLVCRLLLEKKNGARDRPNEVALSGQQRRWKATRDRDQHPRDANTGGDLRD